MGNSMNLRRQEGVATPRELQIHKMLLPIFLQWSSLRLLLCGVPEPIKKEIMTQWATERQPTFLTQVKNSPLMRNVVHDEVKEIASSVSEQLVQKLVALPDDDYLSIIKNTFRSSCEKDRHLYESCIDTIELFASDAGKVLKNYDLETKMKSVKVWEDLLTYVFTFEKWHHNKNKLALTIVSGLAVGSFFYLAVNDNLLEPGFILNKLTNIILAPSVLIPLVLTPVFFVKMLVNVIYRPQKPLPINNPSFRTLGKALEKSFAEYHENKRKKKPGEFKDADLKPVPDTRKGNPKTDSGHLLQQTNKVKRGPKQVAEVKPVEDEQAEYKDIDDAKGSTYYQLKGKLFVRMNEDHLLTLHPNGVTDPNAKKVVNSAVDYVKEKRFIPKPDESEIKNQKSPFYKMDGKARLSYQHHQFRVAFNLRVATPAEAVLLGVSAQEEVVYSPKKIHRHNLGGYG